MFPASVHFIRPLIPFIALPYLVIFNYPEPTDIGSKLQLWRPIVESQVEEHLIISNLNFPGLSTVDA